MTLGALEAYMPRIEALDPLHQLAGPQRDGLLRRAEIVRRGPGDYLYRQGEYDTRVHYLLDGSVEVIRDGSPVRTLDGADEHAQQALDGHGRHRHSVRARTDSWFLSLDHRDVDAARRGAAGTTDNAQGEGEGITSWMGRLLQSGLYQRLPASNIQLLFARMQEVPVAPGDTVIRQGEAGSDYYIVANAEVEVVRELAEGRGAIRLAVLGAGDTFGEEGLISGQPRNATVRVIREGTLMRVGRRDFLDLVCAPLLQALDWDAACARVATGARWLDVRYQDAFLTAPLANALNIPHTLLRIKSRTLDPAVSYVVVSDDPAMSAVSAFLLIERGFDASCLSSRISAHVGPASPAPARIVTLHPAVVPRDEQPPATAPPGPRAGDTAQARPPAAAAYAPSCVDAPMPRVPAGTTLAAEQDPLERTQNSLRALVERALDPEPPAAAAPEVLAGAADGIALLARDLEARMRAHVEARVQAEKARLEAHFSARTVRIREAAVQEIRRYARDVKKRYETLVAEREREFAERSRALRAHQEKLQLLATRIGEQKAGIVRQRTLLEEKLRAASELHRQLGDIGLQVTREMDSLETLVSEA